MSPAPKPQGGGAASMLFLFCIAGGGAGLAFDLVLNPDRGFWLGAQPGAQAVIGAAAAVFRLQLAGDCRDDSAATLARAIYAVDGTAAAHLGAVDAQMSGLRADKLQSQMAATGVEPFNAVLLAEAEAERPYYWREARYVWADGGRQSGDLEILPTSPLIHAP